MIMCVIRFNLICTLFFFLNNLKVFKNLGYCQTTDQVLPIIIACAVIFCVTCIALAVAIIFFCVYYYKSRKEDNEIKEFNKMGDISTIENESKKSRRKEKHKSFIDKNEQEIVAEESIQENNRKKSAKKVSFSQLTVADEPQFEFTIESYDDNDKNYVVEEVKIDTSKTSNAKMNSKKHNKDQKKHQNNNPYLSHLKKPSKTKGVKFLRLKKASSSTRNVYESSNFDIYAFDISSTDV